MSQKVVELYLATLKEYTQKLNKQKLTVLMQVGEFFEIYGLIYPDGTREGNVWDFCDDVNLKVALKPQVVYDRPEIQVYMGGVGESYVNPYLQKAVDRFGWTVVIFEQQRVGNTNKFERKESAIISPGVNINSDNFSNIAMVIYIEQVKKYYSSSNSNTNTNANTNTNTNSNTINNKKQITKGDIYIGVAFVDCLTGENGIMTINTASIAGTSNSSSSDISIPLDELLKLLTIKNPNELNIYLENIPQDYLSNDDLINSLHLFNYNYNIHREPVLDEKIFKLAYQQSILEKVYIRHRGLMDITQQLGLDGTDHTYSRIALMLLLEFILKHDKTILDKLDAPDILINSDKYLLLANNALEQLDVLDNLKSEYKKFNNRLTLLDLLDNTRTPLGKTLLRQRISIPITEELILEERYQQIHELLTIHMEYIKCSLDKFGSPLYQLRSKLSSIKNIENYLRKIITGKIQPFEIPSYLASLEACADINKYLIDLPTYKQMRIMQKLFPSSNHFYIFNELIKTFQKEINIENLNSNVWNGVESNPFRKGISPPLDELQNEIDNDRGFLDNLITALSQQIDTKWDVNTGKQKPLIYTGENASKGIHIYTNTTRKDTLQAFFAKKDAQLKVGHYTILAKDVKFLKMKESKWEIEIPYLKTSNGTLKANIDRLGKLAKQEFNKWLENKIISKVDVLESLNNVARFIAEIDVLQSNVLNAIEKGYTRPVIESTAQENSFLDARLIRHPIIEHIMEKSKYVPNDVVLGKSTGDLIQDGILLFGVNAVGKSSLMKSLGVNIIMAQAGMYVAASSLHYKPFKYLFTRILGNDNLYAGLSSFEVEMKEFKVILRYANSDSLLLCDEVCKGTVTEDGTALVASALEILSRRKVKFLSATHLHNLTNMPCVQKLDNIKFHHLLVEQDPKNPQKLIYTRKLQQGSGPSSYGILVARSMNMDDEFITRAQEIRNSIETNTSNTSLGELEVGSKYHKDKVIGLCEVCKCKDASDVHHINQQCDANSVELLITLDAGIFNKNKLWNLVALCKDCHQAVHNSPTNLVINGYIPTSNGIELDFKWQKKSAIDMDIYDSGLTEGNLASENLVEADLVADNSEEELDIIQKINTINTINTINNNGISNGISNVNSNKSKLKNGKKEKIMIPDDIVNIISEMKKTGATPKKIQFDIKRYHQFDISQQQIREL